MRGQEAEIAGYCMRMVCATAELSCWAEAAKR